MYLIDLRSDTLSKPTDEMLQAMIGARLGDDSYDGDPTVIELEALAADMLGKEAALLVLSGTMGNLISVLAHTTPGDEIIIDIDSHIYCAELGGLARVGGLMSHPLKSFNGSLNPTEVENAIRPIGLYQPVTRLICLENTHNRLGGLVVYPERLADLAAIAKKHNIPIHMDGARIFNAAVGTGLDVKEFTRHVDSLMFCLSKGLSCPLGSLIVGERDFIKRAKQIRQMIGGGMRQAGIIAAAGIIALKKMIPRMAEDHFNARKLAEALINIEGLHVDLNTVQTNIFNLNIERLGIDSKEFVLKLEKQGILVFPRNPTAIRIVTYHGIRESHIKQAVARFESTVRDISGL